MAILMQQIIFLGLVNTSDGEKQVVLTTFIGLIYVVSAS